MTDYYPPGYITYPAVMKQRPEYTIKEARATAIWLRERAAGYPVPYYLQDVYSSHAESRVIAARIPRRKRTGESRGRTPRSK